MHSGTSVLVAGDVEPTTQCIDAKAIAFPYDTIHTQHLKTSQPAAVDMS